mmetsp:Transcript_56563/g.127153  ORF Transcript_56563/g.127153 Transcript_56563/m.127153 type:complete len:398 (+) Transcript_56563:98-1291(+)
MVQGSCLAFLQILAAWTSSVAVQEQAWTAVHQWSNLAANITVLRQFGDNAGSPSSSWKLLHITDAHISLAEAKELHATSTRRMHNAFSSEVDKFLKPGVRRPPAATLRSLLEHAEHLGVDAILLGGDIVNFPHNDSVQYVHEALRSLKIAVPVIYTAGNHDWMVEGSQESLQDQREKYRREVLWPLYRHSRNRSPIQSQDVGLVELLRTNALDRSDTAERLLILSLDNSIHEVTASQAEFIRKELGRGHPTLLVVHIPFMLPGATPPKTKNVLCGDPRYGWDNDNAWQIERRQRWPRSGSTVSTKRFIDDLIHRYAVPRGPLLGILSGHEHTHRADALGASRTSTLTCKRGEPLQCEDAAGYQPGTPLHEGLVQYVTEAGFEGGHRIVEVRDSRSEK